MDETYDLVIIGAGEAGQAAAHRARKLGGSVAIVDRELFGGSCPFWPCIPSKALLHAAAIQHLCGGYPWRRASDFRDWMIVRERPRDWPDDSGQVGDLEAAGAVVIRVEARIDGPGRVIVRTASGARVLGARAIVVAVGSNSTIPDDIEGLDRIRPWTNREATTARELPGSLVVLGAGPTGVEMSQVYVRYGVPTSSCRRTSGSTLTTIPAAQPPSTPPSAGRASTSGQAFARPMSVRWPGAMVLTSSSSPTRRASRATRSSSRSRRERRSTSSPIRSIRSRPRFG